MDKQERDRLERSIKDSEEKLDAGLIAEDARDQLYRMIYYYKEKIAELDKTVKQLNDYTYQDCLDKYEEGFHIVISDGRISYMSNESDD